MAERDESNLGHRTALSRRSMLRAVGASGVVAVTSGALITGATGIAHAAQANWRWCTKCEGLWFNGHPTSGVCPAGGGHSYSGSGNYVVKFAADGGGDQDNWRWCTKCQGLWFNGHPTSGACPAGGGHSYSGSGNYLINFNPTGGGQRDWRWCTKCEGLWFNGHPTFGVCPAGGGHSYSGSGDYILRLL